MNAQGQRWEASITFPRLWQRLLSRRCRADWLKPSPAAASRSMQLCAGRPGPRAWVTSWPVKLPPTSSRRNRLNNTSRSRRFAATEEVANKLVYASFQASIGDVRRRAAGGRPLEPRHRNPDLSSRHAPARRPASRHPGHKGATRSPNPSAASNEGHR